MAKTSLTKDNFYRWMCVCVCVCAVIRSTLWISIEYVELKIGGKFLNECGLSTVGLEISLPFQSHVIYMFSFQFFPFDFEPCASDVDFCIYLSVCCQSVCFSSLFCVFRALFSLSEYWNAETKVDRITQPILLKRNQKVLRSPRKYNIGMYFAWVLNVINSFRLFIAMDL